MKKFWLMSVAALMLFAVGCDSKKDEKPADGGDTAADTDTGSGGGDDAEGDDAAGDDAAGDDAASGE